MRNARVASMILLCAWVLAVADTHAQPLFSHASSIESTVINADLVFIAKVEKFSLRGTAEGREGYDATISVEETIKQDLFTIDPYTRVSVFMPASEAALTAWVKGSTRLLVALDSEAPQNTVVIQLSEGKLEVWTAGMELLREPEAVVKTARAAARSVPASVKRVHTFGLNVPRELAKGTGSEKYYETGGHLVLSVPVDERLEKRSRENLRSGDLMTRHEGAKALRFFKSEENIAKVKSLLGDTGHALRHHSPEKGGRERVYVVRYAAYETLKAWGVEVATPVLREDVPE